MAKQDWKNESGDSFEAHAQQLLEPIYPWLLHDLQQEWGKPLAGLKIVEIGCGPGFMNGHFIAADVAGVVEIDLSLQMLIKAETRGYAPRSSFIQADAAALPLQSQSFDIVFSRGSLFFWENMPAALAEIARILRRDGMAFIGGGYGMSTPEELLRPIKEHSRQSRNKEAVPRLDIDALQSLAARFFAAAVLIQSPGRGFWLKCIK